MTPDAGFWRDMGIIGLLLLAVLAGKVIDRRTVGRLPPQEPGDVFGLIGGLATISCSAAVGIALVCAVATLALMVWR